MLCSLRSYNAYVANSYLPFCVGARNPDHNARPSAVGVVIKLTQPESTLLAWRADDMEAPPEGCKLGAPLEMGESLYKDLQEAYA